MPSTTQPKVINASMDAIWDKLSYFHDLSWASNVVKSSDKVGAIDSYDVGATKIT